MPPRYRQDPDVHRPKYQRIADDLRQRIATGALGMGAQLPTEAQLTEEFDAARETVRRALDLLRNEGLTIGRPPLGVFVRARKSMIYRPQAEFEPAPSAEMDRFMASLTAEGRSPAQSIGVEVVHPPADVAQRLQTGDKVVVVRKRIRSLEGEPYNTNDSYYPRELVQGSEIMLPDDIARGANEVLAELGALQVRAIDEFWSRMPTPDEATRLELPPGSPIFYHLCTGYRADGMPVRVAVNILPGDRHVVVYERIRPAE